MANVRCWAFLPSGAFVFAHFCASVEESLDSYTSSIDESRGNVVLLEQASNFAIQGIQDERHVKVKQWHDRWSFRLRFFRLRLQVR